MPHQYIVALTCTFIFLLFLLLPLFLVMIANSEYNAWSPSFSCDRSSHRRCSVRKGVPKNFAKFTGKRLRPATSLKRLWHRCFPVNFAKFLRTLFNRTALGDCFCFDFFCWFKCRFCQDVLTCVIEMDFSRGLFFVQSFSIKTCLGSFRKNHRKQLRWSPFFFKKKNYAKFFRIENTFERLLMGDFRTMCTVW